MLVSREEKLCDCVRSLRSVLCTTLFSLYTVSPGYAGTCTKSEVTVEAIYIYLEYRTTKSEYGILRPLGIYKAQNNLFFTILEIRSND